MAFSFGMGNPGAMRSEAIALRDQAREVADLAVDADRWVMNMQYESRAAQEFRHAMLFRKTQAERLAAELVELAGYLEGAADQVEWEQGELERQRQLEEQRRREEAERLRQEAANRQTS